MQRFEEVKNKVERTRQTLSEAAERARKHEELKSTIEELKARTEKAIVYKEGRCIACLTQNNTYHAQDRHEKHECFGGGVTFMQPMQSLGLL